MNNTNFVRFKKDTRKRKSSFLFFGITTCLLVIFALTSFALFNSEKNYHIVNGQYIKVETNCEYGVGYSWEFPYNGTNGTDGSGEDFSVPCSGTYFLEAWGAQGGASNLTDDIGLGGYTSGYIALEDTETLYVFVGGQPIANNSPGGYNGGGGSASGSYYNGGGASDIRLSVNETKTWDNFDSLKSRIMVAAGGGGSATYNSVVVSGGYGGGLIGGSGSSNEPASEIFFSRGGSQFDGGTGGQGVYLTGRKGQFGKGGNGSNFLAGGGGGYFGGGGSGVNTTTAGSGAGGSSFVSGHIGCNAIPVDYASPTSAISITNPNHYSNKVFTTPVIIDGDGYYWEDERKDYVGITEPNGEEVTGHHGHGYARITFISD